MDFIEKIFGIAPDEGSGALEILLFVIPMMALYLLYRRRSRLRDDKLLSHVRQAEAAHKSR